MSEWNNPYEAGIPESDGPVQPDQPLPPRDAGWIRQVPVVAILMIVQGGLEIIAGIFYAAMGPFMMKMMSFANENVPPEAAMQNQQPPEEMMWVLVAVYGGMGAVAIICGLLKVVAGIRNLSYKGRVLGFVALGSGLLSSITCYCAPTAIGLAVYGLIVYANSDVARAFEMAKQGYTPDQIKQGM